MTDIPHDFEHSKRSFYSIEIPDVVDLIQLSRKQHDALHKMN